MTVIFTCVSELGTFAGCSSAPAPAPPFKSYAGAAAAASKSCQLRITDFHSSRERVEKDVADT